MHRVPLAVSPACRLDDGGFSRRHVPGHVGYSFGDHEAGDRRSPSCVQGHFAGDPATVGNPLRSFRVAFLATQVWTDQQRAHDAVDREASALRAVVLLSARFPAPTEQQLRALVGRHIQEAATVEWPAMATQSLELKQLPAALVEALGLALALTPQQEAQALAQRETVRALQEALDARRQRIIISRSTINWVKWWGLILEAILALVAIALVHSDNRFTASLAMGTFATAAALAALMVASHAPAV